MAYYTDSPAFQEMWARATGAQFNPTSYRPLGLSGIKPPVQKAGAQAKVQAKPAAQAINAPKKNPYQFDVVSSSTSNAPGGGDVFGTMGTGPDQARSNQAAVANAQGQAQAQTALMTKAMSPAQIAAGAAPAAPVKAAPKAAVATAPKKMAAPTNLLQSREPGTGFGGIRPLMRY